MGNLREYELEEALYKIGLLTQQHLPFSPEYQEFKKEVLQIIEDTELKYMGLQQ